MQIFVVLVGFQIQFRALFKYSNETATKISSLFLALMILPFRAVLHVYDMMFLGLINKTLKLKLKWSNEGPMMVLEYKCLIFNLKTKIFRLKSLLNSKQIIISMASKI